MNFTLVLISSRITTKPSFFFVSTLSHRALGMSRKLAGALGFDNAAAWTNYVDLRRSLDTRSGIRLRDFYLVDVQDFSVQTSRLYGLLL